MYFFKFGAENTFSTFDLVHIIVILVLTTVLTVMIVKRKKIEKLPNKDKVSYILAGILLFLDFSFYVWKAINGAQAYFPIPMHLCSWATYIVALSLIFRRDFLFQVGVYYGITGGLLSILVPEFGGYSFNHMRFYQFFLLHFLILALPLYQYIAYNLKLKYKYIYITLGVMWVQAGIAALVNLYIGHLTGEVGNGMFVFEPPVPLPGILGQSPVYLFGFSIIFILLWHGIYKLLPKLKK